MNDVYINTAGTIFYNGKAIIQVDKDHKTGKRPVYVLGFTPDGKQYNVGNELFDAQTMINQPDAARKIFEKVVYLQNHNQY